MGFSKTDYIPFPPDAGQAIANLEVAYDQWHQARQSLESMPTSMFWQAKNGVDYLAVKQRGDGSATTQGARTDATEAIYEAFVADKDLARARASQANAIQAVR